MLITASVGETVELSDRESAIAATFDELEYVGGEIFANVYQSDWVLRIDAESGEVREILDFGGLLPGFGSVETSENVLNGIAVDESNGHLFITGKRWPALFEIKLDAPRP